MIHSIFGSVHSKGVGFLVVSCGSGIRYKVNVTTRTAEKASRGDEVDLLVYVHRDQNGNETMYGFADDDQHQVFSILLSVSGVGPKTALAIVDLPLELVSQNIIKQNYKFFQAIKGIGGTTAKRLVLELHKRFFKERKDAERLQEGCKDRSQGSVNGGAVDLLP